MDIRDRAPSIISAGGYRGKSSEQGGGLCAACNLFCYGNKRRRRQEQFPPRLRIESFCSLVLLPTWQSTFDVSTQTDCLGRACLGTGMRFEASARVRGLPFASAFILLRFPRRSTSPSFGTLSWRRSRLRYQSFQGVTRLLGNSCQMGYMD